MTNATLLNEALRIAGLTRATGRTPSPDQYAEAIILENLMIDGWNCERLDIFTSTINIFPLTVDQLSYTIGTGGDFNVVAPGPGAITEANILLPGTPTIIRQPVRIIDKAQWAAIRLQLIPGAITIRIYPDYNFPLGKVWVYGQPPAGYSLELYIDRLVPAFVATTDTVALPPGYAQAITYNLALRVASAWKTTEGVGVTEEDREIAAAALAGIQSRNGEVPYMSTDAPAGRGNGGNWNWWRTGYGPG